MKAYVLFLAFLVSCSSSSSGSDAASDAHPTSDGGQGADAVVGDGGCDLAHQFIFGSEQKDVCAASLPMACLMVCGTMTGCTGSGVPTLATCPSVDGGAVSGDGGAADAAAGDGATADAGATDGGVDAGAADVGAADAASADVSAAADVASGG